MQDVDMFVIDYWPSARSLTPAWIERGRIQKTASAWRNSIVEQCLANGVRITVKLIENEPFEDGLDFTVRARKHAFDNAETELFILSDNDMLPYDADVIENGLSQLEEHEDFAILSAMPSPHDIHCLRGYILTEDILEHYACGGFRFCRKLEKELVMPECSGPGYDGIFCRYLKAEHGKSVGYLRRCKAFHLGAHCTTLWNNEQTEAQHA